MNSPKHVLNEIHQENQVKEFVHKDEQGTNDYSQSDHHDEHPGKAKIETHPHDHDKDHDHVHHPGEVKSHHPSDRKKRHI